MTKRPGDGGRLGADDSGELDLEQFSGRHFKVPAEPQDAGEKDAGEKDAAAADADDAPVPEADWPKLDELPRPHSHAHNKEVHRRHVRQRAMRRLRVVLIVLLVIAGILVVAVVFTVGSLVNGLLFPPETGEEARQEQTLRPSEDELAAQQEQAERDAGSEQAGVDDTVSYAGETYALSQGDDGAWSLVNSAGEALVTLEGTPVALARMADTLLMPESRDGGWDVPCYVVGGHTQGVTYVVGTDGNPVQGSGGIASVELDGTTLRVTDDAGTVTDVALA